MKKCVECRTPIEKQVPFDVCCGGKIGMFLFLKEFVSFDVQSLVASSSFWIDCSVLIDVIAGNMDASKPNNVESAAESLGGSGSASADPYAASVSAALSSMNINSGSTMNNGRKDTTHSDVQKLQEQLNDIKEQVSSKLT